MKAGRMLPPKYKRIGEHAEYYIPWEGKEQVDKILGSKDPSSAVFTVKFPGSVSGGDGIKNNFSFEQFLDFNLEETFKDNAKPGGPVMNPLSASSMSFQPG